MITIRPEIRRPGYVISAVAVSGFCLVPSIFLLGSPAALIGPGSLVALALMCWLLWRPIRLEITETEVRARQGWARGQSGKNEAFRSEICSINYLPGRITFQGADGRPRMEAVDMWTVRDMSKAAEELQVPLYDHRVGLLGARELRAGRLVYDPASGLVPRPKSQVTPARSR